MQDDKVYFEFLNDLRESGVTNMFGVAPYLVQAFDEDNLTLKQAREILGRWMKGF